MFPQSFTEVINSLNQFIPWSVSNAASPQNSTNSDKLLFIDPDEVAVSVGMASSANGSDRLWHIWGVGCHCCLCFKLKICDQIFLVKLVLMVTNVSCKSHVFSSITQFHKIYFLVIIFVWGHREINPTSCTRVFLDIEAVCLGCVVAEQRSRTEILT